MHRGNRHFTIPQKGMGEWRVENGRTTDSKDKISVTLVFSFGFFLKVRSQFISIIICFSLIFVVKLLEKKETLKKDKMIIIIMIIIIIIIIIFFKKKK